MNQNELIELKIFYIVKKEENEVELDKGYDDGDKIALEYHGFHSTGVGGHLISAV